MAAMFYHRKLFCTLKHVALPDEILYTLILGCIFPTAYTHAHFLCIKQQCHQSCNDFPRQLKYKIRDLNQKKSVWRL